MNRTPIAATAALVLLALTGCGGAAGADATPTPTATPSEKFTASGTISTRPSLTYFAPGDEEAGHTVGDECISTDNYDDIAQGTQVVVTDDSGKTVGVGSLNGGVLAGDADITSMLEASCSFSFSVRVDSPSKFFGVEAGNDARGDIQVSREDLKAGAELSLMSD
jgi:hypothetical protein